MPIFQLSHVVAYRRVVLSYIVVILSISSECGVAQDEHILHHIHFHFRLYDFQAQQILYWIVDMQFSTSFNSPPLPQIPPSQTAPDKTLSEALFRAEQNTRLEEAIWVLVRCHPNQSQISDEVSVIRADIKNRGAPNKAQTRPK